MTIKEWRENISEKITRIEESLKNHLSSHEKSERFNQKIFITLIGIIGTLCVSITMLVIKIMLVISNFLGK